MFPKASTSTGSSPSACSAATATSRAASTSDVRANYLMSPAAGRGLRAGRQHRPQLRHRSARRRPARQARLPARHLAHAAGSRRGHREGHSPAKASASEYATVTEGDANWQGLSFPTGDVYQWEPDSTYIRQAPYFDGITPTPAPVEEHHRRPRARRPRRLRHHRPHLPRRFHQGQRPGRQIPHRTRRQASRLQQLRLPPRQP